MAHVHDTGVKQQLVDKVPKRFRGIKFGIQYGPNYSPMTFECICSYLI